MKREVKQTEVAVTRAAVDMALNILFKIISCHDPGEIADYYELSDKQRDFIKNMSDIIKGLQN